MPQRITLSVRRGPSASIRAWLGDGKARGGLYGGGDGAPGSRRAGVFGSASRTVATVEVDLLLLNCIEQRRLPGDWSPFGPWTRDSRCIFAGCFLASRLACNRLWYPCKFPFVPSEKRHLPIHTPYVIYRRFEV